METLLVWCLLLIEEVTCFFGWRHCHLAAVSYSFNILIFIPFLRIPFRSIPGPFRFQFRNDPIPPELGDPRMLNLAEVPAKFNSCGFHKESVGQGKDLTRGQVTWKHLRRSSISSISGLRLRPEFELYF